MWTLSRWEMRSSLSLGGEWRKGEGEGKARQGRGREGTSSVDYPVRFKTRGFGNSETPSSFQISNVYMLGLFPPFLLLLLKIFNFCLSFIMAIDWLLIPGGLGTYSFSGFEHSSVFRFLCKLPVTDRGETNPPDHLQRQAMNLSTLFYFSPLFRYWVLIEFAAFQIFSVDLWSSYHWISRFLLRVLSPAVLPPAWSSVPRYYCCFSLCAFIHSSVKTFSFI